MASSLNDNIPQWKKDLILRKRAQNKCTATNITGERQLSNAGSPTSAAGISTNLPECPTAKQRPSQTRFSHPTSVNSEKPYVDVQRAPQQCELVNENKVNMVQDSVISVHKQITTTMVAENGVKHDADSDSSEELHYGPGIVSKLKSKYLSLTLREKKITTPRQSILPMRRATSLENLLDADSSDEIEHNLEDRNSKPVLTRRYTPRSETTQNGIKNTTNRYRSTVRSNESMKRARSVETLHAEVNNRDLANEDVIIIDKEGNCNHRKWTSDKQENKICNGQIKRPKRLTSFMDEAERPPADHVRHTMMLFEGPPVRRTKGPKPTGEVAAKVASYKNIIEKEKTTKKNNAKPQITPKPVVQKSRKVYKPASPTKKTDEVATKRPASPLRPVSPIKSPDTQEKKEIKTISPVNELEKFKFRPTSPEYVEKISATVENVNQNSDMSVISDKKSASSPENCDKVIETHQNNIERQKPDRLFTDASYRSPEIFRQRTASPDSPDKPRKVESPIESFRLKTPSPDYPDKLLGPIPFPRQKSPSPTKPKHFVDRTIKSPSPELKSPDLTNSQIPDVSTNAEPVRSRILSETPDLILHSSPQTNMPSPNSVKKFTENFITTEKQHSENNFNGIFKDDCDGITTKPINKEAQENISQACHSVTFSISDNIPKSHLPRLGTVPVGINRLVPDIPTKPVQKIVPKIEDVKKCEAINELASKLATKEHKPPKAKQNVIKNNVESNNLKNMDAGNAKNNIDASNAKNIDVSNAKNNMDASNAKNIAVGNAKNNMDASNAKNIDAGNAKSRIDAGNAKNNTEAGVIVKNNVDSGVVKSKPPTPVSNKNLTNREITKNFINTAKTFEQPISKVVVSVKSVEDVVNVNNSAPSFLVKPASKPKVQEQTSLLFNFQDRDSVPDYIAHDNTVPTRRGKREKPKVISYFNNSRFEELYNFYC